MMMPCPTYESDGRTVQCHALSVGRHSHVKTCLGLVLVLWPCWC